MSSVEICQEQVHYTVDPIGEGTAVGSFYCILKKGHEGPHRIFCPDELEMGQEGDDEGDGWEAVVEKQG